MYFENRPVAPVIEKTTYENNSHYEGANRNRREQVKLVLKIVALIFSIITSWCKIDDKTSRAFDIQIEITSHTFCAFKHVKSTASEFTLAVHLQRINETTEIFPQNTDTTENLPSQKISSKADSGTNANNQLTHLLQEIGFRLVKFLLRKIIRRIFFLILILPSHKVHRKHLHWFMIFVSLK